jgi:peptidoglycan/LPS O-acetylase OafA/YrhL
MLALSVLIGHAGGIFWLPLPGGMMAVQAFYIISGFYMGLVLSEKYQHKKNTYSLFISNRFLRIFPTYWVVLTMAFIISLVSWFQWDNPLMLHAFVNYPINEIPFFYAILVNIIVLGQDVLMFVGLTNGGNGFFFTPDFHDTFPRVHQFLLIQPSWTIALEFTFYLIVPFLNRFKTSFLLILVSISFLSRFIFYISGYYNDPWYYRFFPFEIGFFIAGILAYRIYVQYKSNYSNLSKNKIVYLTLLALLLTSGLWPGPYMVKCYLTYILIFIALPFIFSLTKNNKLDRSIGELSYPLYICHYPLLEIITDAKFSLIREESTAILLIVVSLICAIILNKLVAEPIEKIRQSRV